MLFSLPEMVSDKKIRVDFDSPDISSNGGLVLIGNMQNSLAWQIGQLIPDSRKKEFIHHTYMEMVSQRIGQILCGYEDANDCNQLRGDSALKMSVGRKPSDSDLSSQSTMTRLENCVDSKTLYKIGKLFLDEYISSFEKAPKKVIIDGDDTNANTYGSQQLTLFNAYYDEYCYMPMLLFDGLTGKLMLPLLRPGRRNKSLSVARIIQRVVEYLHEHWPNTVIELRGDSHFASHEFMDWAHDKWYVRYLTGLSGNSVLLSMVDKPRRRAENDYRIAQKAEDKRYETLTRLGFRSVRHDRIVVRRYYKLEYKAESWKYAQRVIAKIEVSSEGTNIRFVVTKNRNNGLCTGTQDEAHRVQGDRGGEIHHGQSHQAHHAQCCLHRGEEDIYQNQFLAPPQASGRTGDSTHKNGCIVGQQHYNHGIRKRPQARTESFVPMCHKTGS